MDIEEIIIETLRLAEQMELESDCPPNIYTCLVKEISADTSVFSEIVLTGELCVCAHSEQVATLLFFLLNGIFDHNDNRLEWYTQMLERCVNMDYDDVTAENAVTHWTNYYLEHIIELKEHNITQPIVIYPIIGSEKRGIITLTPSICDIWTLPRIKRQFTE